MPMLALLLLMAGLCNRDAGTGHDSLRLQILQADAQRAASEPATHGQTDSQSVQILRLSADRVLQVAHGRVHAEAPAGQRGQARSRAAAASCNCGSAWMVIGNCSAAPASSNAVDGGSNRPGADDRESQAQKNRPRAGIHRVHRCSGDAGNRWWAVQGSNL